MDNWLVAANVNSLEKNVPASVVGAIIAQF